MKVCMDHVAIKVRDFEWHVRFFEDVFEMKVEKELGEKPERKLWFQEGIQLNESSEVVSSQGGLDHIGIAVECKELVLEKSRKFECKAVCNRENWFETPTNIVIELK